MGPSGNLEQLVLKVSFYILNPLIAMLFGAALIVFLWGVFEYFWHTDSDEARTKGSHHMIWGVFGMFIMFGAFAIIRIIVTTIGGDVSAIDQFKPGL